jgi:hypothetical protein
MPSYFVERETVVPDRLRHITVPVQGEPRDWAFEREKVLMPVRTSVLRDRLRSLASCAALAAVFQLLVYRSDKSVGAGPVTGRLQSTRNF